MFTEDSKPVQNNQKYQYVFTGGTATYNRRHTLHRVYESLKAQTYRDLEWLIVDDGSTDNSRELVEQWQQENLFPIRYIYQENAHLHIAFNRGVGEAQGELFIKLDSDDSCEPQALERFKYHWDAIPLEQKEKFSAVTCVCKYTNGKIVGAIFPFNPTDSDSLEIRYRFKLKGEKWGFHRTEVLLKFLCAEQIIQTNLPESVRWSRIAKKYKTRFVKEALRTYWTDQPSIMRNSQNSRKVAIGAQINHLDILNDYTEWFRFEPLSFLRSAVHYRRFSFHLGNKIRQQIGNIKTSIGKILWLIALPVGYSVYLKDNYTNKAS
ncbi:glycosyltransferase family A protein [Microcoleus sp. T3_B1]|uniref:glycosyltransferase family A protein n=1 Tax=unclassified Microcoleus TaxID=2642155 RepID=UPI002FD253DF